MSENTSRLSTALADRYAIESRLGEGGMATVYLAQDLKHDRKVALKVLRPELAAVLGAERFVQEIKTTAALQHPHILPLFDSGEADSFLYYVMPYIEGETLRGKLNRETQLGIDEAVQIASDVADALDYAHRNGVIHRDIKPENILLHDGRPMVADFGIALAVSAAAGGRMTETGLSLGTPHYMSPEQATAEKEITGRSDIYSLGSVLYEMLTGEPPHTGASAQAIVMKIVADDARPVTDLRKTVPPNVAAAVAKSIAKLPADRFTSAKDFAEALSDTGFVLPTMAGTAAMSDTDRPGQRWNRTTATLAGLLAVVTVVALAGLFRSEPERPVVRQQILLWDELPGDARFLRFSAAIAPDGSAVVYRDRVGDVWQLVVKHRGELAATPLAGTDDAIGPFYSPDGAWIGFFVGGELRRVPSGGGAALTIADSGLGQGGPAWLADNTILFNTPTAGLRRVDAAGGPVTAIVETFATYGRFFGWATPLPDARGALLTACLNPECAPGEIWVYDARADTVRQVLPEGQGAWYAEGHLLYGRADGGLFAAPFDLAALEIDGPSVPVLDDFLPPNLLFADDGTALYVQGDPGEAGRFELVWVDRTGRATRVQDGWTFDPGNADWGLSLSPDGRRIAVREQTDLGMDIWIKQLPSGPRSRFTLNDTQDRMPRWSPDGRFVTFISLTEGEGTGGLDLYQAPADGTGAPELLFDHEVSLSQGFYSPDGEWLVLRTAGPRGSRGAREILGVRVGTDSVVALVSTDDDEQAPAVSPDSRWLAYLSDETGRNEVFIRPFPDTHRGKWQVSDGGAFAPVWGHTGPHLFFVNQDRTMMQATIDLGPPFSVTAVEPLFELPTGVSIQVVQGYFDVTRDDQRFVMRRQAQAASDDEQDARQLVSVQNWFKELRERLERR